MTTAVGWYGIAVGTLMAIWWVLDIRGGALRRPDRAAAEIGLHLAAELLTAALLVAGGTVLLVDGGSRLLLVALGMLLYTIVQSPGYFLARHEMAPVVMLAALIVLTAAALVALLAG
jgi:hypothetical protein